MWKRKTIIKTAITGLFACAGLTVFISRPEASQTAKDDVLTALANYKTWGRVTKKPFKVVPFSGLDDVDPLKKGDVRIEAFRIGDLAV